jgi:heme oxygenase
MTTTATPNDNELTFTERLRHAVKEVHDQSDRLVNLKLSLVLTSKPLYTEAISLFWPIYAELEALLEDHKDHEHLKQFYHMLEILRRAPRFEKDMKSLLGSEDLANQLKQRRCTEGAQKKAYSPPELQAYIDQLRLLSNDNPVALLAYVYAMYSAILSGGAMIRPMVKRAYGLKTDEGVQMFMIAHDDEFPNSKSVQKKMKQILNEDMQLSEDDKQLILTESPKVFARNNALVASVKDTAIFATTSRDCLRYIGGIIIAVGVAIAAMVAFYASE